MILAPLSGSRSRFRNLMRDTIRPIAASLMGLVTLVPSASHAEWRRDLQIVSASGSQRLALRYLLESGSSDAKASVNYLASELGLAGRRTPSLKLSAQPIFRYDNNVNSGIASDEIRIGRLDFTVDEDSRAKAGVVLGARANAGVNLPLGNGLSTNVSGNLSYEYAPEWSYSKHRRGMSACLKHSADNWAFLDGCFSVYHRNNGGATDLNRYQSVTLGRLYSGPSGLGEVAMKLQRRDKTRDEQMSATFSISHFQRAGYLYQTSLYLGEKRLGTNFATLGASAALTTSLFSQPTTVAVDYLREEGAEFFGEPLVDQTYTLSVSRPITSRLVAQIYANRRNSTVDAFSETSVGIDFFVKPFDLH